MRHLRWVLLVPLLLLVLAACDGGPEPAPEQAMPALRYDYLTKLRLAVASVDIEDQSVPNAPGDVALLSPEPPAQALRQMAEDRLVPAGSSGRAVFVIENASIIRGPDGALTGSLTVRLDIVTGSGNPTAYAEARVSRIRTNDAGGLRPTLYEMTRQMMDDMNVEFEYQLRHALKDWLQDTSPVSAPAPVQQQPLDQPPS